MRKYVLIFSSAALLLLSIIIIINKRLIPIIDNKKYAKELEQWQANSAQMIKDAEKNREEAAQKTTQEVLDGITTIPTSDGQRVGMYIGKFMTMINSKKYKDAYEVLNEDFKNLNFPTFESFETYMKENFKRRKSVEYVKFKLENDVYVVSTILTDLEIYGSNITSSEQVFMFRETEAGKYEISFGL